MARSFLVSDLVTMAKQLGDFENSSTLADSEWRSWISAAYARYHNKLVQTGMGYLEATQTISASGVSTYALPSDYHSSIRVDYDDGDTWAPLEHISVLGKHAYETSSSGQAYAWRIAGTNLELLPAPTSGSYRHIYIPGVAKLTSDGTTVYFDRGFEELVVIEAVIRARTKEETETSDLRRERDHLLKELDEALATLTWGESPSIADYDSEPVETGDWYPSRRWLR